MCIKKEYLLVSTLRKAYILHGTPLPFVTFPFPIEREFVPYKKLAPREGKF
jgi:hypothetical protein